MWRATRLAPAGDNSINSDTRIPATYVCCGSRPCENSNARRARRNILEKLRVLRTDNAADIRLDAMSENCVFYISLMYEFSHSLDPQRTSERGAAGEPDGHPPIGDLDALTDCTALTIVNCPPRNPPSRISVRVLRESHSRWKARQANWPMQPCGVAPACRVVAAVRRYCPKRTRRPGRG